MKQYSIISEVRGAEQFLVVNQMQEEYLNDYLMKMVEHNTIAGLLPLRCNNMNGRTALYYQVGNRYKVKELVKNGSVGSREAKILYAKLVDVLSGMGEYFLNVDQCVYDVEYLYVDTTLNPYFIYLPFENYRNPGISSVWRDFFSELLSCLMDVRQEPFYDTLMRYLIRPNFSLSEFGKFVSDQKTEDVSIVVSAQEQLVRQEASTSSEKADEERDCSEQPSQTGKKGLKGSLFGFGKKEKGEKPGKTDKAGKHQKTDKAGMPIPGQKNDKPEIPLVGKKNRKEEGKASMAESEKNSPGVTETDDDQWSATVYINPEEENRTVMLNTLNAVEPYLIHGNVRIPIGQLPFTIGKGSVNYIVANPTVSRLHITIRQEEDGFYVQDEHSSNGTWLDGERLIPGQPKLLHDGASLRLSNEEFTFHEK